LKEIQWIFFVARKYFRSPRKGNHSIPTLLSVAGIAAGVMTLIIVVGVMNGFQHSTIESILELNSYHLRINGSQPITSELLETVRTVPGVRSAFFFGEMESLIRGPYPDPRVCNIRILPEDILEVDPVLERLFPVLEGRFDLRSEQGILLGIELARYLGVGVGDTVQIFNLGGDFRTLSPQLEGFQVVGLLKSGYYEYDASWCIVSIQNAAPLNPSSAGYSIGIKLKDHFKDRLVQREIQGLLIPDLRVTSWREYNRAIFGALRMEKTVMMILIGLIFLVVGGNIYRSHQRNISERIEEIGVLKALGASSSAIQGIFILEGAFTGFVGAFWGNLIGFFLAGRINDLFRWAEIGVNSFFSLVNLSLQVSFFSPANFYISEVQARITLAEALFISVFAVLSTTVAAYGASYRVSSIYPAEVLRYE